MSKEFDGGDVVMFFTLQYCYQHKGKTIDDALNEWAAIRNHLKDMPLWFKHPHDYSRGEFLQMMKPVMEYANENKEFIGCNGKYNK